MSAGQGTARQELAERRRCRTWRQGRGSVCHIIQSWAGTSKQRPDTCLEHCQGTTSHINSAHQLKSDLSTAAPFMSSHGMKPRDSSGEHMNTILHGQHDVKIEGRGGGHCTGSVGGDARRTAAKAAGPAGTRRRKCNVTPTAAAHCHPAGLPGGCALLNVRQQQVREQQVRVEAHSCGGMG